MSDMPAYKIITSPKATKAGPRPKGVRVVTRLTESGEPLRLLSVDANSLTFGEDFLYVFKQGVKRARQENKAILGNLSGAKKKP